MEVDSACRDFACVLLAALSFLGCSVPSRRTAEPTASVDKYSYWASGQTRMRGFMAGTEVAEKDIEDLQEWGANLIRLQIRERKHRGEVFAEVFPHHLADAENVVRWCRGRGIAVVIDYHYPAGSGSPLWTEPDEQDRMVERWREIARRFRDSPNVIGYDLLNEPVHPGFPPLQPWPETGTDSWPRLACRLIDAIRELDTETPIVIEPGPAGGMPAGFQVFPRLEEPRLVISFHMYQPHAITYQGILEKRTGEMRPMPRFYPGELEGVRIDKEWLRQDMQPALEYSREYGVPVLVGEFSCVRWAPGDTAVSYLRDAIDLFEEYGWQWTYHAFREWPGWSLEHVGGPEEGHPRSEGPTDRYLLIRSYLEKNQPLVFSP